MSNKVTSNKREVWIRGNRRAFTTVLLPVLLVFAVSGFVLTPWAGELHLAWRLAAGVIAGFSLVVISSLLYWIFRPLLAYQNGELLVYLNPPHVIKIPIELVEVFFAGQSDSFMPNRAHHAEDQLSESRNIVIRLAERAVEYHQRKSKTNFWTMGRWLHSRAPG